MPTTKPTPEQKLRDRPEADVLREVMRYLALRPDVFWFRANTGGARHNGRYVKYNIVGCPDILACHRDRFIGIECKSSTGTLSAEQRSFRNHLEMAGGTYILARSVEDVRLGLEGV